MGPLRAVELIFGARRQGVRLEANGDRLRVEARPGVVTPDLLDALRSNKAEILELLRRPTIPLLPDLEPSATHAAFLTLADNSTQRISLRTRDVQRVAPCFACGRRSWWFSIHGTVVCGHCHPPGSVDLVSRWIGLDQTEATLAS